MLERYFGSKDFTVIPELGFEVVKGKKNLDEELLKRTSWLTKQVVGAINENRFLRASLVMNFPRVKEGHVDDFVIKLPEKDFRVQGRISDFSVDNNQLHGAEKRWYQQIFKTIHLSDPQARLIANAEELAEDLEESKKKGRLILSPGGLMVYEFSAFTDKEEYKGVFKQTSFISIYDIPTANGGITLGGTLRGKLERFYDDESRTQLSRHRKIMLERRKKATGSSDVEYSSVSKLK
jgi:hypothetical protein